MDFGQQRLQQQEAAKQMMYQNSGYQFERRDKKTLILHYDIGTETKDFTMKLVEPLKIDKLSDIYLESFTTYHTTTTPNHSLQASAYIFNINEFKINSNSNSSNPHTFNKLVIPNEIPGAATGSTRTIHKSKKLNFICSINPTTLTTISGSVTGLTSGTAMFANGDAFIMELLIVARD